MIVSFKSKEQNSERHISLSRRHAIGLYGVHGPLKPAKILLAINIIVRLAYQFRLNLAAFA